MKKLPHIPLYTGDWMKDPELSMCAPATRGVWIDLLCAMHERDRLGELRGTTEQLARLARCSTVELVAALTDLQTNQAAEVEQRNGSYVVANKRMKREAAIREKRAAAGSKGGSNSQANREQVPDYDTDIEGLEKVRIFCREIGIREADADWFFWKCHGNGWRNGGEPIRDWKATLRSWQKARYLPSQKAAQQTNGRGAFPPPEQPKVKRELPERFRAHLLATCRPDDRERVAAWKTFADLPSGSGLWDEWKREQKESEAA